MTPDTKKILEGLIKKYEDSIADGKKWVENYQLRINETNKAIEGLQNEIKSLQSIIEKEN